MRSSERPLARWPALLGLSDIGGAYYLDGGCVGAYCAAPWLRPASHR